jgi:ABC-2 type transport system ATP-binding protein
MSTNVIEIEKLSKWYRSGFWGKKSTALSELSYSVPMGSCFGFLGPNGAGKSTTIKVIVGLLKPSEGGAHILGGRPDDVRIRSRIGYLPENPTFPDNLTGAEVLEFTGQFFGLDTPTRRRRTAELLERTRISRAANLAVRKYSKGMVQRLGIAQALMNDPELIILDEPMSGLDPVGRRDVKDLILESKARGKTVFFSTHIISDVEEICDEMAIVVGGQLVSRGSVHALIGEEAREFEVVARTGSPPAVAALTAQNQQELQKVLDGIWRDGGKVLAVKAKSYGLERVFLEAVAKRAGMISESQ